MTTQTKTPFRIRLHKPVNHYGEPVPTAEVREGASGFELWGHVIDADANTVGSTHLDTLYYHEFRGDWTTFFDWIEKHGRLVP